MKIKLVLQPNQFTSFTSWYLEPLWREYFNIEIYSNTKRYDRFTLFVFWWNDTNNPLLDKLVSQGYKVVVDNLWEQSDPLLNKFYQLNNPNWWRWNESLWWGALGYNQYRPDKTYKKLAFMPIRRVSSNRDLIVSKLGSLKDQMIWSYKEQRLPNDDYDSEDVNQRFLNPDWYNDTCVSLVVETACHTLGLIVSEKSYKPLAFYHPMLIIGRLGALQFLKSQGFETFDNMFNEDYDYETNFEKRIDIVIENLTRLTIEPYSMETQQKLEYNNRHFFNEQLCKSQILKQIIEPLIHYAET